jgi:hypothetical protein
MWKFWKYVKKLLLEYKLYDENQLLKFEKYIQVVEDKYDNCNLELNFYFLKLKLYYIYI